MDSVTYEKLGLKLAPMPQVRPERVMIPTLPMYATVSILYEAFPDSNPGPYIPHNTRDYTIACESHRPADAEMIRYLYQEESIAMLP
jgi:hypothetical protein